MMTKFRYAFFLCFFSVSLHGMEVQELENEHYKHALSKATIRKTRRIKKRKKRYIRESENWDDDDEYVVDWDVGPPEPKLRRPEDELPEILCTICYAFGLVGTTILMVGGLCEALG